VLFSGGNGYSAEFRGSKQGLDLFKKHDVVIHGRHDDHGGAFEHILFAVFKPRVLSARHRVPAHKGEAVLAGGLKPRGAYILFCAAAVDDCGGTLYMPRRLIKKFYGRLRV